MKDFKDYKDYLNGKKEFFAFSIIEDNACINFSVKKKDVVIEANKEGLLSLANYLIDFAYDDGSAYSNELVLWPNIGEGYIADLLYYKSKKVRIVKK